MPSMLRLLSFWALCGALFGCPAPAPPRLNVVLISVDTLRADRLGRLGRDGRSLTPALDAQAAHSVVWTQAHSPSNETLFSHAGIFLGALPSTVGPLDYATFRVPVDAPTLAARMSRAGWRTEAVVAGGHMDPMLGIGAGFQHYQSTDAPFASFQATVPVALDRLEALATAPDDRPFFLFVHGYDCHSPYVKPGPLHHPETPGYDGVLKALARNPLNWERLRDGVYYPGFRPPDRQAAALHVLDPRVFDALAQWADREDVARVHLDNDDDDFIIGAYDGAVAYADTHVGRLLRRIEALGLDDNTVVVVFSDHGEDLLAHGVMNHRVSLHDDNVHTVLMVAAPGLAPGLSDDLVSLIDLSGLVLGLSGAEDGLEVGNMARDVVPSESLLGEVSVRTRAGRIRAPRAAVGPVRPIEAGPGMELLDPEGQALPWSDARGDALWAALVAAGLGASPRSPVEP
jgi:arylsulfatase A-like enzyme